MRPRGRWLVPGLLTALACGGQRRGESADRPGQVRPDSPAVATAQSAAAAISDRVTPRSDSGATRVEAGQRATRRQFTTRSATPPRAAGDTGSASPVRIGQHARSAGAPRDTSSQVASTTTGTASAVPVDTPATGRSSAPGVAAVNRFMSYSAATKTVNIKLYAALNSAQGGFNFNGGSAGNQTITVPLGWNTTIDVYNVDAIPHSAIIIADQTPVPSAPSQPSILRAYTSHLTDGLPPQTGHDTMNFKAAPAGTYLIACGVPGHASSGMYIRFVVSAADATPSNTGTIAP